MPSSVIAAIKYDVTTATLRLIYVSGSVYDYRDVPPQVYEDMRHATSKGRYLNRYIKGKYAYTQIK
ncbi:KTSC domain-containing protein [Chitinophaga pendula]|uniref:KTSC domain-containing protein n=1 Tax=Chitinophaga TaxID=79328 RepID=UPI000BB05F99|nr:MULTISPECIES: KTSC domain-containing protein [Chitinophaga]ASZ10743.1 KTSC domain-containing protein [Chitinophaga sp. MD30]UCJ06282.1 KTSC domain-containing protein [Chitinophaga pendula]